MKGVYEFYWECGRSGSLDGIFIANIEDIKKIIGKVVYFGEVLGKHSEVYGVVEEGDLILKTDDQEFIAKFEAIFGESYCVGYNPLDYYDPDCEDEDD